MPFRVMGCSMVHVSASAPTKVIIAGEHAVVYGARALAFPLDERNRVSVELVRGPPAVCFSIRNGLPRKDAREAFAALHELIRHVLVKNADRLGARQTIRINIDYSGMPKGTGNSASIAAALSLAFSRALGVHQTKKQLFETAQIAEKVAHGAPSGLDARTVIEGVPLYFEKRFERNGVKYRFRRARVQLPRGTQLLLVDTLRRGEEPQGTAELVQSFSRRVTGKLPTELTALERRRLISLFNRLVDALSRDLRPGGDPCKVGVAFDALNELLRHGGVVTPRADRALRVAKKAGALGGKITGAGGRGGALLVYVRDADASRVERALRRAGFRVRKIRLARQGPRLEPGKK